MINTIINDLTGHFAKGVDFEKEHYTRLFNIEISSDLRPQFCKFTSMLVFRNSGHCISLEQNRKRSMRDMGMKGVGGEPHMWARGGGFPPPASKVRQGGNVYGIGDPRRRKIGRIWVRRSAGVRRKDKCSSRQFLREFL